MQRLTRSSFAITEYSNVYYNKYCIKTFFWGCTPCYDWYGLFYLWYNIFGLNCSVISILLLLQCVMSQILYMSVVCVLLLFCLCQPDSVPIDWAGFLCLYAVSGWYPQIVVYLLAFYRVLDPWDIDTPFL